MATRSWVGGNGTWDGSNTTNWSANYLALTNASCAGTTLTTTLSPALVVGMNVWVETGQVNLGTITGGSGNTWTVSVGGTYAAQRMYAGTTGATVPTSTDDASFQRGATNSTITISGTRPCASFVSGGTSGATFLGASTPVLDCRGNFNTGFNTWSMGGTILFQGTTSANVSTTVNSNISISGTSFTISAFAITLGVGQSVTLSAGTLDLAGFTLTVPGSFTTGAGTKNITFNGGSIVLSGSGTAFNNAAPTGFTTTAGTGTGTISMTSASSKTFAGGGSTFNCTINQGGAGALTITGANTFSNITNTVQPASVLFTAGTTTTFSDFSLSGTGGNLITIGSVTAASHTLSKSSGIVSSNYLSISRSTATGGASWYAGANSTDGGNNTGWIFSGLNAGAFFSIL